MQSAHELFIHGLQDILSAEEQLVEALQEQAQSVDRADLKKAFESHQAQTQKQVERLNKCFDEIGEEPEETECKGMAGLIEEFRTFKEEEDPSPDILDIFAVGAATKVEDYEINSYNELIRLAEMMGHTQSIKLLNQNLREELQTKQKMENFANKLSPKNMGMEEQEEASAQSMTTQEAKPAARGKKTAQRSKGSSKNTGKRNGRRAA